MNTNDKLLINNVIDKKLSSTMFGNSIYSNLWYCDNKNKLCITFTPRGACSISFQQFLDLNGLLEDALQYNSFIHIYRCNILHNGITYQNINELIANNYKFVKFIMNPYIRAVSIYTAQTSHNLSFREYLKQLVSNKIEYFNDNDKYHYHPQYSPGEEKIITKYIKVDKNETHTITLSDGKLYTLDLSRYSSIHHGKKTEFASFCGDIPHTTINKTLPKSYKYFYDDEIRQMVESYYKDDIKQYGYSFDDF
jgi:hypothetical protein